MLIHTFVFQEWNHNTFPLVVYELRKTLYIWLQNMTPIFTAGNHTKVLFIIIAQKNKVQSKTIVK